MSAKPKKCKACRGPLPDNRICHVIRKCMACIEATARQAGKAIKYNRPYMENEYAGTDD